LDVQFKPNSHQPNREDAVTHGQFRQFVVGEAPDYQTNVFPGWRPLVPPDDEKWDEAEGWLTEDAFLAYLAGDITSQYALIPNRQVYEMEERPGIALETGKRTARNSHFYHAQFVRPREHVGLLVGSTVKIFQEKQGTVMIGGESRFGDFDSTVNAPADLRNHKTGNLRVVLLTPAYFTGGWEPSNHDWSQWVGSGRLVSAALGKPQPISGWDVAHNRPKPLRHYIPAGSVFFFENATWAGESFTQTPDNEPDFGAMGYGQVALGTW
jgi:CRISPR-associated protein Cmr3